MYSAQQRKEEIERWEKKVARAEAAKKEELEKEAPAMPVLLGYKEPHRPKYESNMERMHDLYLDKLEQTADELYALVAKVINQNDVAKFCLLTLCCTKTDTTTRHDTHFCCEGHQSSGHEGSRL